MRRSRKSGLASSNSRVLETPLSAHSLDAPSPRTLGATLHVKAGGRTPVRRTMDEELASSDRFGDGALEEQNAELEEALESAEAQVDGAPLFKNAVFKMQC